MFNLLVVLVIIFTFHHTHQKTSGISFLKKYQDGISEAGNFPYHAFIATNYHTIVCGAGILSKMHAITAATCVSSNKTQYQVLIRTSKYFEGTMHSVDRILIHPNFVNNLAIVRVNPVWKYNKKVQKIDVATGFLDEPYTVFAPEPRRAMIRDSLPCERVLKLTGDICVECNEGGCELCSPGDLLVSHGKLVGILSNHGDCHRLGVFLNISKHLDFIRKGLDG